MTVLQIASPAKLNVFLYITGKRPDGYHELVSLMAPIGLTDRLTMELDQCRGIQVQCPYPGIPLDETNLASRAASLFLKSCAEKTGGGPAQGVRIHIDKTIPPGGGLGGGSSNAASVLLALNRHFSHVFSREELGEMGMSLGADVPFFIHGGPAIVQGAGETVKRVSFPLSGFHVLVCHPFIKASTARVFEKYDFYLTQGRKYYTIIDPILLVSSLTEPGISSEPVLYNDLEEAAFGVYPHVQHVRDQMEKILERRVYMSGSGSCLFALYQTGAEAQQGCTKGKDVFAHHQAQFFVTSFLS